MRMGKSLFMTLLTRLLRAEDLLRKNLQSTMWRYVHRCSTQGLADHETLATKTLFIESACDDERIIEENVRNVKISSPDVRVIRTKCFRQKLIISVYWLVIG